jgi:hypothetical protein
VCKSLAVGLIVQMLFLRKQFSLEQNTVCGTSKGVVASRFPSKPNMELLVCFLSGPLFAGMGYQSFLNLTFLNTVSVYLKRIKCWP